MNKKIIVIFALGMLLVLAMPLHAQELARVAKIVRLEGWVVDEPGGAKHANVDSKAAVIEAHEQGAALVFVSKAGDIYDLVDPETAIEYVGQNWIVLGKLDPDDKLKIANYIDPSKRKGAPPKPAE